MGNRTGGGNRPGERNTAALVLGILLLVPACSPAQATDGKSAGELETRRLYGKAWYENDRFPEAAAEFRRCAELAPKSAVDYFNLGLVEMRAQQYDEALASLARAEGCDSSLLAIYYVRGIIYKRQGMFAEAVESLQRVLVHDAECRGAYYNLGVCYKAMDRYEEAIGAFKKNEELSPSDPSTQYQLISLYRRTGDVGNAERHGEIFARVKDSVDESEKTVEALERSRYSYIIGGPGGRGKTSARVGAKVRFVDRTAESGLSSKDEPPKETDHGGDGETTEVTTPEGLRAHYVPRVGGATVLADYDGDGDLDIYVVNCSADSLRSVNHLWQNRGTGTFVDVTAAAGVGDAGLGTGAVFGDYDNDGQVDLYVVNGGPNALYRNKGDGAFEDVSAAARANEPNFGRVALMLDYDHDNDLDIFVGNDVDFASPRPGSDENAQYPQGFADQKNALLRNNGDGTFSDYSDEAGLLVGEMRTPDAVAADFDGDSDTDLFIANAESSSRLFLNSRFGKYQSGGTFSPPITAGAAAVAEGDVDHDGDSDLLAAVGHVLSLYVNNGTADFVGRVLDLPGSPAELDIDALRLLDYNNDGWSDLLVVQGGRFLRLLVGAGRSEFRDVTASVGLEGSPGRVADVAAGDVDGDGREDLVLLTRDRGLRLLRNESGERSHWLNVRLEGKMVNRSGYGATVEVASAGHYQKQTYGEGVVHFGLGNLEQVDVVRVVWPNGVAQNVVQPAIDTLLTIEEHVRVSASCGFLYARNGREFELVNEILGIGPLGVPKEPGVYHQPDCTELTKISARQLAAEDGFYDLRLTEELRETMYVDQIALRVVDHPRAWEIIPNEMFTAPPFPQDRLFAVADPRAPVSAVDDRGVDVLDLVLRHDGRCPTFPVTEYEGVAYPHALTLDLGDLSAAGQIMLFMDAWIFWSESSTVMAMAQNSRFQSTPLSLEVRDGEGRWQRVIDAVGLPTSKGLIVPIDLTGRFLSADYHVRLSTTMCVYIDHVFVSTQDEGARCRVTVLPVAQADLHFRGFSAMKRDSLGYESFDYAQVSPIGSWNPAAGAMTRYGDVSALLARPDDQYVIMGAGDELGLRFDAGALPGLPDGWGRDFVFYANGWVKDGDLNTKLSSAITPLPFHGMSGYPYPATQQYPDTEDNREYQRTYNTRPGRLTIGQLRSGE